MIPASNLRDFGRGFEGDGWIPGVRSHVGEVIDHLPEFHRMAVQAGRDPASLPITLFRVAEDVDRLRRYRDAGVARAVISLPAAKADEIMPILDR